MPTRHALDEVGWRHGADNSVGLGRETCLRLVHIGPHHAQLASGSASHGYMGQDTWERQQKRKDRSGRKDRVWENISGTTGLSQVSRRHAQATPMQPITPAVLKARRAMKVQDQPSLSPAPTGT